MGKRLERFGEVRIIDETNGFGLDFVEKTERLCFEDNFFYCRSPLRTLRSYAYRAFCRGPSSRFSTSLRCEILSKISVNVFGRMLLFVVQCRSKT